MLLLTGDSNDLTSTYMAWLAKRRAIETVTLAEDAYGITWWMWNNEQYGKRELVTARQSQPLLPSISAFVRFNPEPGLPDGWDLSDAARELFIQERRAVITEFVDTLPGHVVNRPSAGRSNGAKPLHMARLQRYGFRIPEWVASNDRTRVLRFLESCRQKAVVKAASGLRSHVRMVDEQYLSRLESGTTPSIVQRYVHGHEVRVHVVGDHVFGSRIDAAEVDYRFDTDHPHYSRQEVPLTLARLCIEAARREGLILAGLDFRVDDQNVWWCLEMNPVPTFLPYEASTGHAIGDYVLDYLMNTPSPIERESPLIAFAQLSTIELAEKAAAKDCLL